jgi:DNA polymerase/3'-5' exonuclease PolX
MKYPTAKALADRIVEILQPHCEVINIAGSIRRQRTDIGDVEVVAIPTRKFKQTGLFPEDGTFIVPAEFHQALEKFTHQVIKGTAEGRYLQLYLKNSTGKDHMKLDLFMPAPEDYWRIFAIRTGSADYSAKVIAKGWANKGWCGVSGVGLRMQKDCTPVLDKDGKTTGWKLLNTDGERPPVWTSEQEFFEWIGVRYIEPQHRELQTKKLLNPAL